MDNNSNTSSFNVVSDWNTTTSYEKNDIVQYSDNYYFALTNSTNVVPTNTSYWATTDTFIWKPQLPSQITFKLNSRLSNLIPNVGATSTKKSPINNALMILELNFNLREEKEAKAILFFLEFKRAVNSFYFTVDTPYNSLIRCVCMKWNHTFNFNNNHQIQATFEEIP